MYTLGGSQKEWVAFLANVLHSECGPMYPVYTTFENLSKYCIGKKIFPPVAIYMTDTVYTLYSIQNLFFT